MKPAKCLNVQSLELRSLDCLLQTRTGDGVDAEVVVGVVDDAVLGDRFVRVGRLDRHHERPDRLLLVNLQ